MTHPAGTIQTLAIIGAGTGGRDFALLCVSAGFHVVLEDVMPAKLRRAEEAYISSGQSGSAGTLRLALTVEDAVREADLAIDFVPDELESKLEIFCMLDRMAPPRTILLTPTNALSITDLASCTYRPERCFGLQGSLTPDNPVALITSRSSDLDCARSVVLFLRSVGLAPSSEPDTQVPMLSKHASPAI